MTLITKAIARKLPKLYETENTEDPTVHLKLFTPDAQCTWFITEMNPDTEEAFGYATLDGCNGELGYISVAEIRTVRGQFGLPVERDQWFESKPLSVAKQEAGLTDW